MWSEELGIIKVLFNTYKDNNEHMTKETFINNNIFSGCLHSKGVVLHIHLGSRGNMLIY